jgi:hypothetical protein
MNDIPLESAPPRREPVFSPAPPNTVRAGRFDDHLRRAESAPRDEVTTQEGKPNVSLEQPREDTRPTKLHARRSKRAQQQTKDLRPDGAPAIVRATRDAADVPAVRSSEPVGIAHSIGSEAVTEPALQFAIEPDAAAQVVPVETPVSQRIAPPLSLVEWASPNARDDSPAAREPQAVAATGAIELISKTAPPVVATPTSPGPALPVQPDEASTETARREVDEPPTSRTTDASGGIANILVANLVEPVAAIAELVAMPPLNEELPPSEVDVATPEPLDRPATSETTAAAGGAEPRGTRGTVEGPTMRAAPHASESHSDAQQEVDRVRFVQRVSRAFQSLGNQEGHVRLRLSPPSLGALTLEVTLRGGEMVARMETETAAAKNLLLDSLPALRERLSQHEVRVARFDVDLADHRGGGPAGRQAHPDDLPRRPSALGRASHAGVASSATAVPSPGRSSVIAAQSLDVLI